MKVIPLPARDHRNHPTSIQTGVLAERYDSLHRHDEMEITLVLNGEGTLTVGNYTQAFKQGQVYIIAANQPHNFSWPPAFHDEINPDVIRIYFDFKRIPETFFLLQELSSIRKFISSCTTCLQVPQDQEAHAAKLITKVSSRTNLERLLGLLEIFQYFSNDITGWKSLSNGFDHYSFPKSESNRMHDVFRYTLDNYAEHITLNKIASVAHITPHAFCKYFKQHTKKTYNNFLNEVRVNEACRKIINGSYEGLSSIAFETGFKGASNFNRVFKKTTGMSPSDYRKEFRNKTA
jgi:AraC-like DNA-binding protein